MSIRDRFVRALERITGDDVWTHSWGDRGIQGWPSRTFTLRLWPNDSTRSLAFRVELNVFSDLWGWKPLRVNEDGVGMSLSCGASVHATIESTRLGRWLRSRLSIPKWKDREISVSFHDAAMWWRLWSDPDEWKSGTPRWKDGNWHPLDTFLGRCDYESEIVETAEVVIPMPEKGYRAKIQLCRDTWKRPRSPFKRTVMRAHSEMLDPIPVPGKGENSWDCGEDAHFGSTRPAESIIDAVIGIYRSAMRTREKYGDRRNHGLDWRPVRSIDLVESTNPHA